MKKIIVTLIALLVLISAVAVGYLIWNGQQNQQNLQTIGEQTQPGSTLQGKPATLSVTVYDDANDNTQVASTTRICSKPVVETNKITCGSIESKTTSASTSTDYTSGLNVGTPFIALAGQGNATQFGFPTEITTIATQQDPLSVKTYGNAGYVKLTIIDNNLDISNMTTNGTINYTLGDSQTRSADALKFEVISPNVAFNVGGYFIDVPGTSNISKIEASSDSGAKIGTSLASTSSDDYVFELDAPQLLREWDSYTLQSGALVVTADSDGCAKHETFNVYAMDKVWTPSSKDANTLIYAFESDASSPADSQLPKESIANALS